MRINRLGIIDKQKKEEIKLLNKIDTDDTFLYIDITHDQGKELGHHTNVKRPIYLIIDEEMSESLGNEIKSDKIGAMDVFYDREFRFDDTVEGNCSYDDYLKLVEEKRKRLGK